MLDSGIVPLQPNDEENKIKILIHDQAMQGKG